MNHWGSELGLKVLSGLSKLYTSLVWESTVLLALCSEDILPANCEFGRADMSKLLPKDFKVEPDVKDDENALSRASVSPGSNGVSQAMESLSTSDTPVTMDTEESSTNEKDSKKLKLSPALQVWTKLVCFVEQSGEKYVCIYHLTSVFCLKLGVQKITELKQNNQN